MHEAFFFGPDNRRLFGSYHPPASGHGRILTVICPPLLSELGRTHSALRKLAISLAEAGHHVLRFDYFGTGDSFGMLEEATVADWLEDIATAVQEGRDISGCTKARIVGVRAGALLACKSVGAETDVERLVLWDPPAKGIEFVEDLRRMQAAMVERNPYLSRAERRDAMIDHGTYRLSDCVVQELSSLDADINECVRSKMRVVSSSLAHCPMLDSVPYELVDYPCDWQAVNEDLIIPHPILERLIEGVTSP
jgi:pimeloyl-ACP methyl ester carboxylesterase